MKRKTLVVLAVAALCATGLQTAFAVTGTGWKSTATLSAFTVGEDTITYAVTFPPYVPTGEAVSSHNTAWTRHRASIRCRNNFWPFNLTQVNGSWIYSGTIGGPANHSWSGPCGAGYSFQDGGAWIDEVF